MEEKKTAKQVDMKPVENTNKLYTEEQLNTACKKLYNQMFVEIQKRDAALMSKRLDYLFQVLKYKDCFDSDFVKSCADELQVTITLPEEQPQEQESTPENQAN